MKISDVRLRYVGFGGCDSVCRVRVFERAGEYPRNPDEVMLSQGLPPQPKACVIVLTELPENDGTSVTNMMGHLANTVFYNYPLMGFPPNVHTLHLPLFQTFVIEHYPPDPQAEREGWEGYGDDRFAYISFKLIDWDNREGRHIYAQPDWRVASKAEIEEMIGEPWEVWSDQKRDTAKKAP